ncbi:Glucose--fructose oxidoreductase [Candidatus Electronema halotolerans]
MGFTPLAPLRAGIIGGSLNSAVGYTHFNASRLDGHFLVEAGCFSRDAQQNENSARIYGVSPERIYSRWQQLLEQEGERLDAVVVLTPTPAHAEIVTAALEFGYPVICEKALGVCSEECRRIDQIIKEKDGFLAVTYNYSGYPMVRELRRMISEGRLGELQQIHIEMPQEGFLRRAAQPQAWRCKDYAVPTVSLDLGVHVHHLIDFLTGGKKPQQIVGDQSSYGPFHGVVDNVYCLARYQDNLRVQAWWGKTALGQRNGLRVRVFGSKAAAEWYQMEPEDLRWSDDDGHHFMIDRGSGEAETARQLRYNRFKAGHPSGFIEAFANLYADIAEALRTYKKTGAITNDFVYSAAHAQDGLYFLETVSRSAEQKCWLALP